MAYKNIEDKRKYNREYRREQREMWKHLSCCCECGRQDAFTIAGRYRCADCAAKHSSEKKDRDKISKKEKLKRKERREKGICTCCGMPLPTKAYPYVMCEKCRATDRRKQEERRRNNGIVSRYFYAENGLCVRCGRPRIRGLTAWGGEIIKLCENCYESTKQAASAGRARYKMTHGTTWGNFEYEYENRIRHGEKGENP